MVNNNRNLITEGQLSITGKDSKGQDITVEAEITGLEIEVVTDTPYSPYTYTVNTNGFQYHHNRRDITFKAKIKDTYTLKTSPAPKGIERTARVLGWEDPEKCTPRWPTLLLIKAAAEKAGVDESTDFTLIYENDIKTRTRKVYVEFKWTD